MESVIDRIFKIIEHKAISVSEFSKVIGVSNGYLAKQRANKANVGSQIIEKIVRNFSDINPFWLITGDGSMFIIYNDIKKQVEDEELKNFNSFYKNYAGITRLLEIFDKENISEVYENISFLCHEINSYIEHYSLFNNIEHFLQKCDKSEINKKINLLLSKEKELLKILLPHLDIISELQNKLYDFDSRNDRAFYFDELSEDISDIIESETEQNTKLTKELKLENK